MCTTIQFPSPSAKMSLHPSASAPASEVRRLQVSCERRGVLLAFDNLLAAACAPYAKEGTKVHAYRHLTAGDFAAGSAR